MTGKTECELVVVISTSFTKLDNLAKIDIAGEWSLASDTIGCQWCACIQLYKKKQRKDMYNKMEIYQMVSKEEA